MKNKILCKNEIYDSKFMKNRKVLIKNEIYEKLKFVKYRNFGQKSKFIKSRTFGQKWKFVRKGNFWNIEILVKIKICEKKLNFDCKKRFSQAKEVCQKPYFRSLIEILIKKVVKKRKFLKYRNWWKSKFVKKHWLISHPFQYLFNYGINFVIGTNLIMLSIFRSKYIFLSGFFLFKIFNIKHKFQIFVLISLR